MIVFIVHPFAQKGPGPLRKVDSSHYVNELTGEAHRVTFVPPSCAMHSVELRGVYYIYVLHETRTADISWMPLL